VPIEAICSVLSQLPPFAWSILCRTTEIRKSLGPRHVLLRAYSRGSAAIVAEQRTMTGFRLDINSSLPSPRRLRVAVAVAALTAAGVGMTAVGGRGDTVAAGQAAADGIDDLRKTLAEVLRARRPEEFGFLDRVTALVDKGTLPRSMVVSTFNWARKKPRHPFQYFEFGLRERASRIGVHI
jgi:hypothetical protein